jgi:hypothetical protein
LAFIDGEEEQEQEFYEYGSELSDGPIDAASSK